MEDSLEKSDVVLVGKAIDKLEEVVAIVKQLEFRSLAAESEEERRALTETVGTLRHYLILRSKM